MPEQVTKDVLELQVEEGIATLTIQRPDALNALNSDVLDAIAGTMEELQADAVILTGAGDKAFVAGADIAEMADMDGDQAAAFSRRGQKAFQMLSDFPGPAVAAINGFALGGGLEVALACDILVAADNAVLGLPETTLGVCPGFGGTQRLPRRVGPGHAKRLLMTGDKVNADEALAIGLVDVVTGKDDLMDVARGIAERARKNGPLAVQAVKRLVDDGLEQGLPAALEMESEQFGELFDTQDQKEGMQAFLEKRRPSYGGH